MSARGKVKKAAIEASSGPAAPRQFHRRDISDEESRYANELRMFVQQGYASALGLRGTMGFDSFGGGSSDPTTRASPAMNERAHETIVSMRRVAGVWVGLDTKGAAWLSNADRAYAKEHHWVYPAGFVEDLFGTTWLDRVGKELRLYAQATLATPQARKLGREYMMAEREAERSARARGADESQAAWLKTIHEDDRHWWRMESEARRHAAAAGDTALFDRKWDRAPTPDEVRAAIRLAVKCSRGAGKGKGSFEAQSAIQRAFKQAKRGVDVMYGHYARGRRGKDREEVASIVLDLEVG